MNFQPLKDFLDYYLPMLSVPGSETVIYKNHEEIFRHRSGFDNIKYCTPVRENGLYNVYSCSKVVTAVAATQLIERGEIVPTDPLYAYFPEYRDIEVKVRDNMGNVIGTEKPSRPILIRDILTMTSGMNYNVHSDAIKEVIKNTGGRAPTVDICKAIAKEPLEYHPGTHYLYSISLDVAGGLVEVVSGMRFSQYVKENIFDPLGMKDSYYHITPEIKDRMAVQYNYDEKNGTCVEIPSDANMYRLGSEFDSGGAGIVSSVNDFILLADALANGGVGKNGNRILSSYGLKLMTTNVYDEAKLKEFWSDYNTGYGYGYGVRVNMQPQISGNIAPVGEFGWDGARLCYLSADPQSSIAVFHAEHMGGVHKVVIPRLRNLIYSCIEY